MPASLHSIAHVVGRQILDSRGRPTVEADVVLENGFTGRACVPSGASTGRHEAHELRDRDPTQSGGLGVSKAVANVIGEIAPALRGLDVVDQATLDARMVALDGTDNLGRLGANGILAVSLAAARAAAAAQAIPVHRHINRLAGGVAMAMPMPMTNILSGGAHAGRGMDIQDFLAVPISATTYTEALAMVNAVRAAATTASADRGLPVLLADEGGLSPGLRDPREALDLLVESIEAAGYRAGTDVAIALDVAATEFFADGSYELARQGETLSGSEMVARIVELVQGYPILSIEDPLSEDDWDHWRPLTKALGSIQLLGDDLFVTNPGRIAQGIERGVANAVLIKVNQNGTLSGTLDAMRTAWNGGYRTIVSARSGETEDSFISDLAVGTGAGQIKIGSTRTSERLSKYNQLLRIEQLDSPRFAGAQALVPLTRPTIV